MRLKKVACNQGPTIPPGVMFDVLLKDLGYKFMDSYLQVFSSAAVAVLGSVDHIPTATMTKGLMLARGSLLEFSCPPLSLRPCLVQSVLL